MKTKTLALNYISIHIPKVLKPLAFRQLKAARLFLALFVSVLLFTSGYGQTAIWTNPITGTNPGASNPYTTGDVKNPNISVSGMGRGSSLTNSSVSLDNVYNATGFTTGNIDLNGYFNFTITPNAGYKVSMNNFVYTSTGGSKVPATFAFRSNANSDNFNTNIGNPNLSGTTISLIAAPYQNLSAATSFRLYGGSSQSPSGTYGINDFTFNGTVLGSPTTALNGFTYVYGSGPSTAQSFIVNGAGLAPANATVTVAGSTNYEVSTTSASSGFGSTATLTASGGNLTNATVWVRLKSGLSGGTYNENITFGGGGVTGIQIPVTGSVTPTALTVTADNETKIYGSANPAFTITYSGFKGTDNAASLTTQPTVSTTSTTTSAVGTYPITPSGAASSNYTFNYVSGTLAVTAAVLTVTADNQTKTYGSANPAVTVTFSGFKGMDNASSLTTQPTVGTTVTTTSAVGTYPITASGAASPNYTFNYVSGTLTVTTAVLTVTADNQTKTYGSSNPALWVTYGGFKGTDNASSLTTQPTVSTTATTTSAAGTYPITASGAASSNYTFNYVSGTLTVTTAVLTVSLDNQTKTYGTTNPSLTITYSGFKGTDNASSLTTQPTASTTTTTTSAVGTYPITASGAASPNYTFNYISAALTVTAAVLTVTSDNQTKTYGSANPALMVTYSGFRGTDNASSLATQPTVSTTATTTSAVGTYPITASGAASSNYTFNYVSGTLTVTAAVLTVTADNQTKTYGTTNPSLTITYSGFKGTDNASSLTTQPTVSTTSTTTSAVGTYPITASGAASSNYTFNYVSGTLAVTTAVLTLTADNQTKTYGTTNPSLTITYSGFKGTDNASSLTTQPTVSTTSTTTSAVGTYPITASGAVSPNYTFNYVSGILTVTKATVSIALSSNINLACEGTNITLSAALTANPTGVTGSLQFFDGTASLGTTIISNDAGLLSTSTLSPGSHTITVTYSGDQNYNSITSSTLLEVINGRSRAALSGSTSICNGSSATLSLAVTGPGTISGTLSDGTAFSGTAPTITVLVSPSATTTYTIATLNNGTCTSIAEDITGSATVTVYQPVSITIPPTAQSVCATFPVSFAVAATGDGLTYQWYRNDVPLVNGGNISGATTNNLSYAQASETDNNSVYKVVISGTAPCSPVATTPVTLTVDQKISITEQPISKTACENTPVTLSVNATASDALTFQWRKNGNNINGEVSNTLTIASVTSTDAGDYDVVISGPADYQCPTAFSVKATLTVILNSTIALSSAAGTDAQTKCINTAIANITYAIGGGATGAGVTGLPAGVTGAFSAGVFTISGTPTASGTFNYTVTTTGPCVNNSLNGTITVNANSTIALSSATGTNSQTICVNNAIANITYAIGGGGTGATITAGALPAGVTGTFAGGVFTISGTPTASGTFNYTVTTTGPCVNNSLSGTITVNANSTIALSSATSTNSQTVCINNTISNITYAIGGGGTGATITAGALPTGVSGTFTAGVFTISGTPTVSGTFNYTVTTTGPCVNNSSSGTIIVNANSTIALSSATGTNTQTLCVNNAITNVTYAIGGGATGATIIAGALPAGVTGTFTAGVFTMSGTPTASGTFNYTVATTGPCVNNSLSGTITVNANSTITLSSAAGTDAQTKCINTAIANISYAIGGGGTGASITAGALPAGVAGTFTAGVFTISGTPTASGTFPYTVTTSGPCLNNSLSGTIIVNANSTIALSSATGTNSQTKCINTAIANISYAIGGGGTGATITAGALPAGVTGTFAGGVFIINGTPTASGTFNYTVTTTGPCVNNSLSGTITVNANSTIALSSATATNSQTVCINNAISNITYAIGGGGTGASITAGALPAGVTGAFTGGVFTISGTPTASGTFNYTVTTTGPCVNNSLSGTITVNANSTISLSSAPVTTSQTACINTAITNITYAIGGGGTGATVSGLPQGVGYSFSGGILTISGTPTSPANTYTYTVTAAGTCIKPSLTGTITVKPDATINLTSASATTSQTVCISNTITNITYGIGGGGTAAIFAGLPAGVVGSFSGGVATISGRPTVAGSFNYIVTTTGACAQVSASGTITVTPAAVGGTLSPASVTGCYGSSNGTITLGGQTGTIVRWESSTNGGATWTSISNTTTSQSYTNLTQSTLYRVVLQNGVCTTDVYSSLAMVVVNPPFTPTITSVPSGAVCLGTPVTFTASGFAAMDSIGGGDFNLANPTGWDVTTNGSANNFSANANNADVNPWSETNDKTFNSVYYNSQLGGKFAIVNGTGNSTLETPVFATIGRTDAGLNFYQAFNLSSGTIAKIEISTDGGNTYNATLRQYIGPANFGTPSGSFTNVNIPLTSYLGMSNLRIRFSYQGTSGSNWAIDNVNTVGGYQAVSYTWLGPTLSATTGSSVTANPTATGPNTYNIITSTGGCTATTTSVTVNVNPVATLSGVTTNTVCSGTNATISLAGLLPNSTNAITYNIANGASKTASVTASSTGTGSFATAVAFSNNNQLLTITSMTIGNCPQNFTSNNQVTLLVNPLPSVANLTTQICSGSPLSVTPTSSVANTTYTWNLPNYGSNTSISGGTAGSAQNSLNQTLTNTGAISGNATYTITPSANGCPGGNFTITGTVNPLPTATISGPAGVCQNANQPNMTFIGASGTAPYTFTYKINNGAPQTVKTLSGNSITIPVSTTTPGTFTYTLIGVQDASTTSCLQSQSGSATITVNLLPTVYAVTGGGTSCSGSSVAIGLFGSQTGVTYQLFNGPSPIGTAVAGTGVAISFPNQTAAGTYKVVATGSGCPTNMNGSATITVGSSPTIANQAVTVCSQLPFTMSPAPAGTTYTWGDPTYTGSVTGGSAQSVGLPAISQTLTNNELPTGTAIYTVTPTSGSCPGNTFTVTATVNTNSWNGNVSTDWSDSLNWCSKKVPTQFTSAIIPSNLLRYPVLSDSSYVKSISIQPGTTVTLAGKSFNIYGDVIGSGLFVGDAAATLTLGGAGSGTLYFSQATDSITNVLKDFTINTTIGTFTVGNQLYILNELASKSGTLNANGNLTLRSTSVDATARVSEVSGAIKGDVTVERFIPAKRAFRLMSPSVTTTTSIKDNWMEGVVSTSYWSGNLNPKPGYGTHITGGLVQNGFDYNATGYSSIFNYDNVKQAWDSAKTTSGTLTAGVPWRVLVRGSRSTDLSNNDAAPSNTIIRAKGTLKTGDVVCDGSGANGTPVLNSGGSGWNFVGNPYASAIDWNKVVSASNNISQTYWAWDPTVGRRGVYVTYDGTRNSVTGVSNVDNNIQSGQGFFVQTTGSNPKLTFQESYKTTSRTSVFRIASERPMLSVQLMLNEEPGTQNTADGLVAVFDENFKAEIGDEDSYKFTNLDETMAIDRKGVALSIEGRPIIKGSDTIQLRMSQFRQNSYFLKLNTINFDRGVTAFVKDAFLGVETPINMEGVTVIPFSLTTDAASSAHNRFTIIFNGGKALPVIVTDIKASLKEKAVKVEWTSQTETNIDSYEIERSEDGQNFVKQGVVSAKGDNSTTQLYEWLDQYPLTGSNFYRIKVVEKSGEVKYTAIVKVEIARTAGSITVYPNPVKGNRFTINLKNMEKGRYIVMLYNNAGQIVFNTTINHDGRNAAYPVTTRVISKGSYQLYISNNNIKKTELLIFE